MYYQQLIIKMLDQDAPQEWLEQEASRIEDAMRVLIPGGCLDHLSRVEFGRLARRAARAIGLQHVLPAGGRHDAVHQLAPGACLDHMNRS